MFHVVLLKTISIFLTILVGFFAGKRSLVCPDSLANLLFYFIAPIVFFAIPTTSSLTWNVLSVALVTFLISTILALLNYYLSGFIWQDLNRNFLAMSAGAANNGYFMLPIAASIFDEQTLRSYMMAVAGINIYETSIGFYLCTKSGVSIKDSILRVAKLPVINAFLLGCVLGFSQISLPNFLVEFVSDMRTSYSVLGMLMLGINLAKLKTFIIDWKFSFFAFFSKFILYPVVVNILIILDQFFLHYYQPLDYNALRLLSIAPISGGLLMFSSFQNFCQEKIAITMFLSLVIAILYVPSMIELHTLLARLFTN